jgi:hypothetical protein
MASVDGRTPPADVAARRELYFVTNDAKFYVVDVRQGASFEFGAPKFLFEMPANTISVRNATGLARTGSDSG